MLMAEEDYGGRALAGKLAFSSSLGHKIQN